MRSYEFLELYLSKSAGCEVFVLTYDEFLIVEIDVSTLLIGEKEGCTVFTGYGGTDIERDLNLGVRKVCFQRNYQGYGQYEGCD